MRSAVAVSRPYKGSRIPRRMSPAAAIVFFPCILVGNLCQELQDDSQYVDEVALSVPAAACHEDERRYGVRSAHRRRRLHVEAVRTERGCPRTARRQQQSVDIRRVDLRRIMTGTVRATFPSTTTPELFYYMRLSPTPSPREEGGVQHWLICVDECCHRLIRSVQGRLRSAKYKSHEMTRSSTAGRRARLHRRIRSHRQ